MFLDWLHLHSRDKKNLHHAPPVPLDNGDITTRLPFERVRVL